LTDRDPWGVQTARGASYRVSLRSRSVLPSCTRPGRGKPRNSWPRHTVGDPVLPRDQGRAEYWQRKRGSSGNRMGRSRGVTRISWRCLDQEGPGPRAQGPGPVHGGSPRASLRTSNMIEIEIRLFRLSCGQHFLLDSFVREDPARIPWPREARDRERNRRASTGSGHVELLTLTDERGGVLLVRHTYGRENWELPGGGVEQANRPWMELCAKYRERRDYSLPQHS